MGEHSDRTALQPNVAMNAQIQTYLAAHRGQADPRALHILWGGGNDAAYMLQRAAADPAHAQTYLAQEIQRMAATTATQAGMLARAGADLIVIPTTPNIAYTPAVFQSFAQMATAQVSAQFPAAIAPQAQADLGTAFAAYTRYDRPDWWLGGLLQLATADYDTARHLTLGPKHLTQNGSTGGNTRSLGLYGGYRLPTQPFALSLLANLDYTKGRIDGFSETGGGATQLYYGSRTLQSLQSGFGLEAALPLGDFQPYARLRWVKEWKAPRAVRTGLGGAWFATAAPARDQSWLDSAIGVTWQAGKNLHLFAQASRDFARSDNRQTTLTLGLTARF